MNFFLKSTAIALSIASLTACLEVEDSNNNDAVVAALQEQNAILAAQNEAENAESSVTLAGRVKNISTDSLLNKGVVKIKVGNEWSEPVLIGTDGSFTLENLPFNSDFTVLVSSEDGAFIERAYFGTTKTGTSGVTFQDMGLLTVSEGELFSYSILDSVTNESITGLELFASSYAIRSSRYSAVNDVEDYHHVSTYNEGTEKYEISLPKDISLSIYASLDLDNDGKNDFKLEGGDQYSSFLISSTNVKTQDTVYLIDQQLPDRPIELRVSMLDAENNAILNQSLVIDDEVNGKILSEFDEVTQQYVLMANLSSLSLRVLSPAFSVEEQFYESGYINLSIEDNRLRVYVRDVSYSNTYYVPLTTDVLDLVLKPKLIAANSDMKVLTKSTELTKYNPDYEVYYSQPIGINADSVSLMQKNVLSVIKGNDSSDDLVLSGSTLLRAEDIKVEVTTELLLNNTQLKISPKSSLTEGYEYQYDVHTIRDSNAGTWVNLNNDSPAEFYVEESSTGIFNINSLRLDNNNYYTNAELIHKLNTAGEESNYAYRSQTVYLIIPTTAVTQLNSLMLRKMLVTKQGNTVQDIESWRVIHDGQLSNVSLNYALGLAENELLLSEGYYNNSVFKGLNVPDGKIHTKNISDYMYDNTEALENSITFEYSYETKDGVISTGSIVLPVE